LNLREILVRPVRSSEEQRYQELMQEHHYLGCLPKISETIWDIALWADQWVGLLIQPFKITTFLDCFSPDRKNGCPACFA